MKLLTWVNGTLVVATDTNSFVGAYSKPAFVKGAGFYYEPTLKTHTAVPVPPKENGVTIDIPLTSKEITAAEKYIDNFVFPKKETPTVKVETMCVDADGNYLGLIMNDSNYTEVTTEPTGPNYKWVNDAWVDSVLINSETKKYIGVGDTRSLVGLEYAPNTVPDDFEIHYYFWDGTKWDISLVDAKECKLGVIRDAQNEQLKQIRGLTASLEASSYITQETEAKAWTADNTISTPFIDGLLLARAKPNETKTDLVNIILTKATLFTSTFSTILGKFQNITTAIENATTVEEIKLIKW